MHGRVVTLLVLVALAASACGWVQDQAAPPPRDNFTDGTTVPGSAATAGTSPDEAPSTSGGDGSDATGGGSGDSSVDGNGSGGSGSEDGTPATAPPGGGLDPSPPNDPTPTPPDPLGPTPTTLPEVVLLPACSAFVEARRIGFELAGTAQLDSVDAIVLVVADGRQRMSTIRENAPSQAVKLYAEEMIDIADQLQGQLPAAQDAAEALVMVRRSTGTLGPTVDSMISALGVFCPNIR